MNGKELFDRVASDPRRRGRLRRLAEAQARAAYRILGGAQRLEGYLGTFDAPADLPPEADPVQHERLLRYYQHLRDHIATMPEQPRISVLVSLVGGADASAIDAGWLHETLASVALQTYPHWQVSVSVPAGLDGELRGVIERFAAAHGAGPAAAQLSPRVSITEVPAGAGHAQGLNAALTAATGEYVSVLAPEDRLYPQALSEVVRMVNRVVSAGRPRPGVLYSDDAVIDDSGAVIGQPRFKPGWSPLFHLVYDYLGGLVTIDRELLTSVGSFRPEFDACCEYDAVLRAVERTEVAPIHLVLYQHRLNAEAHRPGYDGAAAEAVEQACARRGLAAKVHQVAVGAPTWATAEPTAAGVAAPGTDAAGPQVRRVDYQLPQPLPLVSVVIPTRNNVALLRRCVEAVRASSYPELEVVVVNNDSDEPDALAYLDQLRGESGERAAANGPRAADGPGAGSRVQVVDSPGYFNFARITNTGVAAARGQYVVLLNNDTEPLAADWLEQLLMYAQMPNVGAVGAQLVYPDGAIQHAGVVGAPRIVADHILHHARPDGHEYLGILSRPHEVMAVTAAALMVSKEDYLAAGALDEMNAPNAFGDVDLCLRLGRLGLTNVINPAAVLVHQESASRARGNIELDERNYMRQQWGGQLLNDAFVNPNLHRDGRFQQDELHVQAQIDPTVFAKWLWSSSIG